MTSTYEHISVCICTFKRPKLLANLLACLQSQITDGLFTYSILVIDNDYTESAKGVVEDLRSRSLIPIDYYNEPEQNIALARNKAVENSNGNFITFIDDDEFPGNNWLIKLYKTCKEHNVDGVLGPVIPHFEKEPPGWITKGKLFERPHHNTGVVLQWENTRTGNVLLKKEIFSDRENRFNKVFLTGEDRDFFKRMIEKEYVFIWCEEAPVYEIVPPERWKRTFMLRRALLRGQVSINYPFVGLLDIIKSVIAFSVYTLTLPFFLLIGHHVFMKYLIKDFDHLGKVLAFCRIDVIKKKYVLE